MQMFASSQPHAKSGSTEGGQTDRKPQLEDMQSNPTDVDTACNKLASFLLELPRHASRWALSIVVSR